MDVPGALAPRDRVVEMRDEACVGSPSEVERPPALEQALDLRQALGVPQLGLRPDHPAQALLRGAAEALEHLVVVAHGCDRLVDVGVHAAVRVPHRQREVLARGVEPAVDPAARERVVEHRRLARKVHGLALPERERVFGALPGDRKVVGKRNRIHCCSLAHGVLPSMCDAVRSVVIGRDCRR